MFSLPVQWLSANRQNLGRLVIIRVLVLAAQAGSVGIARLSGIVQLPWTALAITLGVSAVLCLFAALRPGGFLCLGHTESMARIPSRFRTRRFPEAIVYQRPEDAHA